MLSVASLLDNSVAHIRQSPGIMASFPLQCIICSKTHEYSDISHLLTHVASKSHLSNYFHAQVRSHQDAEAAQQLRVYDEWYSKNGMEKLLSQRMLQKESRKNAKAQPRQKKRATRQEKPAQSLVRTGRDAFQELEPVIDPYLFNDTGERTNGLPMPRTSNVTFKTEFSTSNLEGSRDARPMDPHVGSLHSPGRFWNGSCHLEEQPIGIYSDEPSYEEMDCLGGPKVGSADPTDGYQGEPEKADITKLKGIIWPGMDLFDAASPEAKRMRNQKKENSVLVTMRANSELVEPTEVIYFPSWELKSERFISGEVESSPPPEELPKKRKRAGQFSNSRVPLLELDPNLCMQGPNQNIRAPFPNAGQKKAQVPEILGQRSNERAPYQPRDMTNRLSLKHFDVPRYPSTLSSGPHLQLPRCEDQMPKFPPLYGQERDRKACVYPQLSRAQSFGQSWQDNPLEVHSKGSLLEPTMNLHSEFIANKENIAPMHPGQGQKSFQARPSFDWPGQWHPRSKQNGKVPLQRQMPPSLGSMATHSLSYSAHSSQTGLNSLGHLPHASSADHGAWQVMQQRVRSLHDPSIVSNVLGEIRDASLHGDPAVSSGDETIDQGLEDEVESLSS